MQVERTDAGIRVRRELEDGWFQNVEMPLPALLTIQSGINKLRYATLMGIKRARTKEIRVVKPDGPAETPRAAIERVYPPRKSKQTEMLEGSAREAAAKLVEKLRFEARVL
jgi:electron transfer flavoprotein beta subunit